MISPPKRNSQKKRVRFGKPLETICKNQAIRKFRKILVSVKFVSAILGPETAAPIFMDAWKKCVLSTGKPMSVKFLVLGGGGYFGLGGEVPILFLWARGFFLTNLRIDSRESGHLSYSGKLQLIGTQMGCQQKNSIVSEKTNCKQTSFPWKATLEIFLKVNLNWSAPPQPKVTKSDSLRSTGYKSNTIPAFFTKHPL